jgi:hypothetical protein
VKSNYSVATFLIKLFLKKIPSELNIIFQEFRRTQTDVDILHDFFDISRYIKRSRGGNSKRKLEERQEVIFSKIFG